MPLKSLVHSIVDQYQDVQDVQQASGVRLIEDVQHDHVGRDRVRHDTRVELHPQLHPALRPPKGYQRKLTE